MTPGLAVAAGGQVAFRAPGVLPGASVVAVGAVLLFLLSLVSWCSLMVLFGCTQGCLVPCVLLCFSRSRARLVCVLQRDAIVGHA